MTLKRGEADMVEVGGTLTADTIPTALERSRDWFRSGGTLTVDLSNVTHSDSAGVALLLEWLRRARAQHVTVRYVHAPEQMRAIAEFGELEGILQLAPDESHATHPADRSQTSGENASHR